MNTSTYHFYTVGKYQIYTSDVIEKTHILWDEGDPDHNEVKRICVPSFRTDISLEEIENLVLLHQG